MNRKKLEYVYLCKHFKTVTTAKPMFLIKVVDVYSRLGIKTAGCPLSGYNSTYI